MLSAPEDIIQYKRNRKLYKEHLHRIHEAHSTIDTAPPSSLGLQHLVTRLKKKQLIEDRQQTIAKQNKHLMSKMTMIMSEDRKQEHHVNHSSLNERERRDQIEKINKQNRIMLERLQKVTPVLNKKKLDEDFEIHKKMTAYLKKKRYGAATVKESPSKSAPPGTGSGTFDAESYMSLFGGGHDSLYDSTTLKSPVHSMSEFRKQIISTKRMGSNSRESLPPLKQSHSHSQLQSPSQTQSHSNSHSHSHSHSHSNLQGTQKKEIKFEMTHEPS